MSPTAPALATPVLLSGKRMSGGVGVFFTRLTNKRFTDVASVKCNPNSVSITFMWSTKIVVLLIYLFLECLGAPVREEAPRVPTQNKKTQRAYLQIRSDPPSVIACLLSAE